MATCVLPPTSFVFRDQPIIHAKRTLPVTANGHIFPCDGKKTYTIDLTTKKPLPPTPTQPIVTKSLQPLPPLPPTPLVSHKRPKAPTQTATDDVVEHMQKKCKIQDTSSQVNTSTTKWFTDLLPETTLTWDQYRDKQKDEDKKKDRKDTEEDRKKREEEKKKQKPQIVLKDGEITREHKVQNIETTNVQVFQGRSLDVNLPLAFWVESDSIKLSFDSDQEPDVQVVKLLSGKYQIVVVKKKTPSYKTPSYIN